MATQVARGGYVPVTTGGAATAGTATLASGTVTVTTAAVTAGSRILLTSQGAPTGALRVSARTAGTSFTITSSNIADAGPVAWVIL